MTYIAQAMRALPLALIGMGCLLLAMQEGRSDANAPTTIPAKPEAAKQLLAPECAARYMEAVIWVEKQAEAEAMPPALFAEAAFTVLRARNTCMHGKVAEALALYDSVLIPAGQRR